MRLVLSLLCAAALLLAGCAHPLTPAVHTLNTTGAFLTAANHAMVAAQDAEAAAAEAVAPDSASAERAEDAVEQRYAPWWDAYHQAWLVWVAGRAGVEAVQAAYAAGRSPDLARVDAAVVRLIEVQERLRDVTEAILRERERR